MTGCFEPNLKLRQAERLFEDQLIGPESIANIGGQYVLPVWSLIHTHIYPLCACVRSRATLMEPAKLGKGHLPVMSAWLYRCPISGSGSLICILTASIQ